MTYGHLPVGMTGAASWLGCPREAGGLKLGDQAAVIPPRPGPHSARRQGEARGLLLRDQEPLSCGLGGLRPAPSPVTPGWPPVSQGATWCPSSHPPTPAPLCCDGFIGAFLPSTVVLGGNDCGLGRERRKMIVFLLLCLPGYHVGDSFPRLNYAGEPALGQAFAGGCGRAWASGISLSEGPSDRGTEDAGLTTGWGGVAPGEGPREVAGLACRGCFPAVVCACELIDFMF